MANTLKFGNGQWATKEGSALAYNDENNNFKPLPFDFTRASSATRVNKDGLIEVVGIDKPRIDFLGNSNGAMLLEPSRTNLITQSEAFDNAYWTKDGSSVVSGFASPSGSLGAFKLVEDTGTGQHKLDPSNVSVTNGLSYSASVFVKKDSRDILQMVISGSFASDYVNFDLTNGVFVAIGSAIGKIESFANGWYKCSITQNAAANGSGRCQLLLQDDINATRFGSYQGDGTSGIYIFGASLEQGSYATSYIPTQGSAVTRLADACNNGANEQVINSTEGVLMAEISALADDGGNRIIGLSDGSQANRVIILYTGINNQVRVLSSTNLISQFDRTFIVSDIKSFFKIAIKYKNNDFSFWVNGINQGIGASGLAPIGLSELSFDNGSGGANFYGNIKQVQYFDTALTDAELIALTS